MSAPWVVLKFGGTSVSSLPNWRNIASVLHERLEEGVRPLVVHSALSGVTDALERLFERALAGEHKPLLAEIEARHLSLAAELGVEPGPEFACELENLRALACALAESRSPSDYQRAELVASGELMATALGAAFLRGRGLDARWVDARTLLVSESPPHTSPRAAALSASCPFEPDPVLRRLLASPPHVGPAAILVTQGFIAADPAGHTVLLGRGGSDTSAAYFAAKLEAARLEIWSDVPGMFSADPRSVPTARLLRSLHYDEAQEIASNGASVLHPRSIPPLRRSGIPLHLHATPAPRLEGTVVSHVTPEGDAEVKAIAVRKGITLVSMEGTGMWHEVGFLADAFQIFKRHGISVDLISTSETNVTVSLDPGLGAADDEVIARLAADLSGMCRVQVIGPAASLSLLGRNIRGILHRLGAALALFREQKIYLVSQAANDLNFTLVIDDDKVDRLVGELHHLLIHPSPGSRSLGPTWKELHAPAAEAAREPVPWWRERRGELLALMKDHQAAYVYDLETVGKRVAALRGLRSVGALFYAMKANPHPEILALLAARGLGFDCVSQGELERVLALAPAPGRDRILFTPNFAPREEYAFALSHGIRVTLDNLHPLQEWPELFRGREILVRVDPGAGRGHHDHVRTAGANSKFGVPLEDLDDLARIARSLEARITGLHAHSGSGIFDWRNWADTARILARIARELGTVRTLDLGGGLGVPDLPGAETLDLDALDAALAAVREADPALEIWLEPGRYLVAEAGVLLARVTQVKRKGEMRYAGVATGMNSLIRPALYGAHHEIVNLTRLDEPATESWSVVGPICESGDQLGVDRVLPSPREGDVLLIANAGAYGRAMSSHYNLRPPAVELVIQTARRGA